MSYFAELEGHLVDAAARTRRRRAPQTRRVMLAMAALLAVTGAAVAILLAATRPPTASDRFSRLNPATVRLVRGYPGLRFALFTVAGVRRAARPCAVRPQTVCLQRIFGSRPAGGVLCVTARELDVAGYVSEAGAEVIWGLAPDEVNEVRRSPRSGPARAFRVRDNVWSGPRRAGG